MSPDTRGLAAGPDAPRRKTVASPLEIKYWSLAAGLQSGEAAFDFKVQLQTDPLAMPVEDVTVEWDEATIRGLRHGAKN